MRPNEVLRTLSDAQIRECVGEAIEWRKTGVLAGQYLRKVAERLTSEAAVPVADATRLADSLAIEEAATRFFQQSV